MHRLAYLAVSVLLGTILTLNSGCSGAAKSPLRPEVISTRAKGQADSTDYIAQGIACCRTQDWKGAISNLSLAIRFAANNASAFEWRGAAFMAEGDAPNAISDFSRAIALDPANPRLFLNRGNAYRASDELRKALQDLHECLRMDSTNVMAYKACASIHRALGEYGNVIGDCTRALEIQPRDPTLLTMRGYSYRMRGAPDKALQDYLKAIELDSAHVEALNELAWLRASSVTASLRDGGEAISAATKACELSHWNAWQYVDSLAAAYAEAGDFTRAIEHQRRALTMQGASQKEQEEMQRRMSLYERGQAYREMPKPQ